MAFTSTFATTAPQDIVATALGTFDPLCALVDIVGEPSQAELASGIAPTTALTKKYGTYVGSTVQCHEVLVVSLTWEMSILHFTDGFYGSETFPYSDDSCQPWAPSKQQRRRGLHSDQSPPTTTPNCNLTINVSLAHSSVMDVSYKS
ncbi:hypothetical protein PV11_09636 [Exophiala sideris]|uniref:Uncharacterized protein n=1 Tax=Exophiala sideris TaxID=1016849 RepID=A0A0D1YSD4_9EURO|nr:hypothetical protein PV11_09636 [Exophiala sideris]